MHCIWPVGELWLSALASPKGKLIPGDRRQNSMPHIFITATQSALKQNNTPSSARGFEIPCVPGFRFGTLASNFHIFPVLVWKEQGG